MLVQYIAIFIGLYRVNRSTGFFSVYLAVLCLGTGTYCRGYGDLEETVHLVKVLYDRSLIQVEYQGL